MENEKKQTVNTYIHRQQDGTIRVIGTDPARSRGTVSRLRGHLYGGREKCLER